MPVLSRDDVEIGAQGTKVVALQEGTAKEANKDYVWLTKQGIYEQIKVSDSATSAGDVWVNTSSKSDETKSAAQQIANNIGENVTVGEKEYAITVTNDDNRDLILAEVDAQGKIIVDEQGEIAGQTYEIEINSQGQTVIDTGAAEKTVIEVVEAQPDKTDIETGATLFAGGTGTKNDPFLIYNYETMQHITDLYDEGEYYYAVDINKTDNGKIDCFGWIPVDLKGSFDGKGVTFKNVDNFLFDDIYSESKTTLTNFNVEANIVINGDTAAIVAHVAYNSNDEANIDFINVNVSGYIEGSEGAASYIAFGPGNWRTYYRPLNVRFINCLSTATLVATGDQACGFIKHPYDNSLGTVYIEDSAFVGNMMCDSGQWYYFQGAYWVYNVTTKYSENFFNTYLSGNKLYNGATVGSNTKDMGQQCLYNDTSKRTTLNIVSVSVVDFTNLYSVGDCILTTKVANATSASVSFEIAPNPGALLGSWMTEEIDLSSIEAGSSFSTNKIKYYTVSINGAGEEGLVGNNYNIVRSGLDGTINSVAIRVVQYDSQGKVLQITRYSLPTSWN